MNWWPNYTKKLNFFLIGPAHRSPDATGFDPAPTPQDLIEQVIGNPERHKNAIEFESPTPGDKAIHAHNYVNTWLKLESRLSVGHLPLLRPPSPRSLFLAPSFRRLGPIPYRWRTQRQCLSQGARQIVPREFCSDLTGALLANACESNEKKR